MKEENVKKAILDEGKKYGPELMLWSNPVSQWGSSGMPDLLGCYKGLALFIEVKSPKKIKKPDLGRTSLQVKKAAQILAAGGHYICTADVEEFKFFMKGLIG